MSLDTTSIVITIAGSFFALILTLLGIAWKAGSRVGEWKEKIKGWKKSYDEKVDSLNDSINNIESSITSVDLPHMEEILHQLIVTGEFEPGNSVETKLKKSGLSTTVSFQGRSPSESTIEIRFDKDINTKSIASMLVENEELSALEQDLFGGDEPGVAAFSPRRIKFNVPSTDFEKIASWVPPLLKKLDEFCIEFEGLENTFDEKLENRLDKN